MKIPRCEKQITEDGITRQCLLESGHEKAQEYFSPAKKRTEARPHEFAPRCPTCRQVEETVPGHKNNVRVFAP